MSIETRKIYSMADMVRETGISQKDLSLLLEHYGDAIPVLMDGDRRKFTPDAIKIVKKMWRQYVSGVKEQEEVSSQWFKTSLDTLFSATEALAGVAENLKGLQRLLKQNPPMRTFYINAFPGSDFRLTRPIALLLDDSRRPFRAAFVDAVLEAEGKSAREAVTNLREVIIRTFIRLERERPAEGEDAEQFSILSSLIRRISR